MHAITEQQLTQLLRLAVERNGSQKVVASRLGISPQYLNDILRGRREPGEKVLKALGYRREVRYIPTEGRL
jgi:transcriptional regulator with XRE-family HTH domain